MQSPSKARNHWAAWWNRARATQIGGASRRPAAIASVRAAQSADEKGLASGTICATRLALPTALRANVK
eukprot:2685237-Amphidinium_carterae.1